MKEKRIAKNECEDPNDFVLQQNFFLCCRIKKLNPEIRAFIKLNFGKIDFIRKVAKAEHRGLLKQP